MSDRGGGRAGDRGGRGGTGRTPSAPVPRARVLLGAAVAVAVLLAIVTLAEALRHPLRTGGPDEPAEGEPASRPSTDVDCPTGDDVPREGEDRDGGGDGGGEAGRAGILRSVTVTSNELYDCPQAFDGRTVTYRGEVVGAVLRRAGGAWVHLNDDVYALERGPLPAHRDFRGGNAGVGVFVPPALAERIAFVGGPEAEGDVLEVVATFRRVDPVSGEVAVLRAGSGRVVRVGRPFVDPPLPDRRVVAAVLAPVAVALVVAERVVARRRA